MTNLEKYKLSLFERCEEGIITEEERDILLENVIETDSGDILFESLVTSIKNVKNNISKAITKPIHQKYDKIMDQKSRLSDYEAEMIEKVRKQSQERAEQLEKFENEANKNAPKNINHDTKMSTSLMFKSSKDSENDFSDNLDKLAKQSREKSKEYQNNKKKSSKEKLRYLIQNK